MAQSRTNTLSPLDSLRVIIRDKRIEIGLTQEQLGFLAGYDRTYLNMVERGKRNPSFTAILNICSVLGILPSVALRTVEKDSGFQFISKEQLRVGLLKRRCVAKFKR